MRAYSKAKLVDAIMVGLRDRIEEILIAWLPFYESDDKDNYVYLASGEDIKRVSDKITLDINSRIGELLKEKTDGNKTE